MLAELEPVVRHEDQQGRVEETEVVERVDDTRHAVVNRHQRLGVLLDELVEVDPPAVHAVDPVPAVALCPHPVRFAAVVRLGIGHRRRSDIPAVRVRTPVTVGGSERRVHRLV